MKYKNAPLFLITLASLLFVVTYLMLIASGVDPFIALIWNVLASLDVNFALLPSTLISKPFVLLASFLDAFIFALFAVALAAIFFDFIKQINIKKRFVISKIRKVKQHIIIVPFNNFALSLAKELKAAGQTCVIITENETDSHRVYRQNDLAIVGDPKNIEAYNIAGIGRAKYVIACADEDLQNALISVTAKSANARAKIISRVTDYDNISKLKSAGAFRMIMPEVTAGTELGGEIIKRIFAK
ncbi:MAG: potassium channel family protein [Candidatus Micrarchaeales archaeon]